MDTTELIKACKMAGMKITQNVLGIWVNTGFSVEFIENPMLPSYVAKRLVAKVKKSKRRLCLYSRLDKEVRYRTDLPTDPCDVVLATDEQRICAAMAVLKEDDEQ